MSEFHKSLPEFYKTSQTQCQAHIDVCHRFLYFQAICENVLLCLHTIHLWHSNISFGKTERCVAIVRLSAHNAAGYGLCFVNNVTNCMATTLDTVLWF